jgi:hypothetical protein
MKKGFFFLFLLCGIALNSAFAQTAGKGIRSGALHTYYADIRNVTTKGLCMQVLEAVRAKSGVSYFETEKFPSKYFILRSSEILSETTLKSWLAALPVQLVYFDEGNDGLERLLVNKAKHP